MMGDFGYIYGYCLILAFLVGGLVSLVLMKARRWMALRRKPAAIAQHIRVLEQIIADWHGTDEELDALIVLENMVLYKQ